ncbi:hypothetical protein AVEN_216035-1 [Araneus ventricosus]|uniref:Uncharacterized protein n=1 Tax=Araneus ventricosus TaxID=182803 RepID=A0A4Y2HUP5_ARAVE|nr:hypothetical protein AVEN_216035-1 [Araneus ventricosus]
MTTLSSSERVHACVFFSLTNGKLVISFGMLEAMFKTYCCFYRMVAIFLPSGKVFPSQLLYGHIIDTLNSSNARSRASSFRKTVDALADPRADSRPAPTLLSTVPATSLLRGSQPLLFQF